MGQEIKSFCPGCPSCEACILRRTEATRRASEKDAILFRVFLYCALLMFALGCCQRACAQAPIAMDVDGVSGVWFPLPEARLILRSEVERPVMLERLRLTDQALVLARREIDILTAARSEAEELSASLQSQLQRAQDEARDANAWYRDPFLWGGIGFVLGAGIVTAIAVSVQ